MENGKFKRGLIVGLVALASGFGAYACKNEFSESSLNSETLKEEVSRKVEESRKETNKLEAFAEYISQFEGIRPYVYDPNLNDDKPEPTIGVGHYLGKDSRQVFSRILPEVDFDSILAGNERIDEEQAIRLFTYDLKEHVNRARKLVTKFDSFPEYLQVALVDMAYRGDLGDSPKMLELFNAGKIRESADEYPNRRDYKDAIVNKMRGLRIRIDSNKNRMLEYAREIEFASVN